MVQLVYPHLLISKLLATATYLAWHIPISSLLCYWRRRRIQLFLKLAEGSSQMDGLIESDERERERERERESERQTETDSQTDRGHCEPKTAEMAVHEGGQLR